MLMQGRHQEWTNGNAALWDSWSQGVPVRVFRKLRCAC